ncbi:hypothetical protein E0W80_10410 [Microbacterium sp. PI-1]|uniref:hypothetical protein n=1 Tax=Microbacterium sp. PI-1 TaxID=2545631 RepID=UPI001039E697|nr:hypothetical protein [Microbacterium sp. PI-1]TCJ23545.1 hypothetical protein E0W80_10410 [Microbacterium sp. PI-1]
MTEDITTYRDQLATERGISDEDRDLLMTGTDEDTLLRQANLLEPLPTLTGGNIARKEGQHVTGRTDDNQTMREFAKELFDRADD